MSFILGSSAGQRSIVQVHTSERGQFNMRFDSLGNALRSREKFRCKIANSSGSL
jgi:hypothetical protein